MMYNFIDVNEVSENIVLPSEALMINGEFIENLIPGYRTLQVTGREALSAELTTYETGSRDGSGLSGKRYPARYIVVKYQLLAESPEAFRAAYNQLANILNVEEATLIFNDERDKFFKGTPEEVGEAPGGTNSVINEFTLFCADPFKYSVTEYEAILDSGNNSFLINYNGTYKAYPTLEAEFFNEDEGKANLTGDGDCGYVAFFNDKGKIIQLGDPDEVDTQDHEKSQTLVMQKFDEETAWGTLAQTNWNTNQGKLFADDLVQSGNVATKAASYLTTQAPSTSGTLLQKTSDVAEPNITYTVAAEASNRTESSIDVKVTITTYIAGGSGVSVVAGAAINLNNTNLYVSSTATSSSGTKSGTFYLWDASIIANRIRITNSLSNVGVSGQVTGWVNVSDIGATTASLSEGYGLKGSIQINGGDWHTVTIKNEKSTWNNNSSYTTTLTAKIKHIEADTTLLEDIKFKVERTDDNESKIGILDETICEDLEISAYTAPVPDSWYLMPETYGTNAYWHGPSITRTIPADTGGDIGAKNFTFTYEQKMSIGSSSYAAQEIGAFQTLLVSGTGSERKVVAGVGITKGAVGKKADLHFIVNGNVVKTREVDLSRTIKLAASTGVVVGNVVAMNVVGKQSTNNSGSQVFGVAAPFVSTIIKSGDTISFNIGGIKEVFKDSAIKDVAVNQITFYMAMYGTKPVLTHNGLYWAKFIKDNCDVWKDIPNKFSTNDIVVADCQSGEVFLNDNPTPSLGALGNDWEEFYLTPGLNQIGFSYSDWVTDEYAPKFKLKYREVFI